MGVIRLRSAAVTAFDRVVRTIGLLCGNLTNHPFITTCAGRVAAGTRQEKQYGDNR
jgi:hypothetical protein